MTQEQIERALRLHGAPVKLLRSNGTVDTFGVLARTTQEQLDGDLVPVTSLTVPEGKADGLKRDDRVEVGKGTWTVATVERNRFTARISFREGRHGD